MTSLCRLNYRKFSISLQVLNNRRAAIPKSTRNRSKPLTYEMANYPHYIARRKGWNSINTNSLENEREYCAKTAYEDFFIRTFIKGTWRNSFASEIIIRRDMNHITICGLVKRQMPPSKYYFLLGYTEELLSSYFHRHVKILVLHLLLAFINVAQTIRKMYFPFTCPKKSLQNKIILITGAANGIGKELVFLLKKLNSSLILMDIDKENLNNLKIQIESDVENILVLNAAMCNHENMVDCSIQKIEKLYQVNILSQYRIIKTFLPEMYTRNAGHIVATCSVAGFLPTIHESDYCATKFAMRGMLECLRCENERKNMYGIKITVVYPFAIDTNLFPGYKLANGFQNVFPVLKKEYVAKQMLNGIELEMDDVVIPKR
ncbi:28S ribosomal protein S24, mitochondrial [Intoshia linei]|uniref:28S ribosomal protein S24, mitochondrial n=1 Tax=Intoshia linei TaxID=1819745 RepID=A0A177B4T9_9BILA|nr:28S ribosomal protein S24, mitochondrial [Intoshia linei]